MRKFFCFVSVFLCLFSTVVFANHREKFIVGTTSGYAPFVSLTPDGKYEGFDIDVAKHLAKKLNMELVIKDLGSMSGLILSLQQGKIDALIWAVSITKERMDEMNVIHYQGEREKTMPFLFWKEVPENINKIEDLSTSSKAICIEAGTSQESILRTYKNLNIKNIDKIMDGVMDVRYGKSLAVAVDPSLVMPLTIQSPQLKVKHLEVPEDLQVMGIGICVSKDNLDLTSKIEKGIEELKSSGVIAKLEKKWKLS